MNSIIGNVLRKVTRNNHPLNIATICSHEPYETSLAATGHSFYGFSIEGSRGEWNYKCRPVPTNYTVIPKHPTEIRIPEWVSIDLLITHNKFGQIQNGLELAKWWNIPLINIEHTLPLPQWPRQQLEYLKTLNGDINVFITEYNRDQWLYTEGNCVVIEHGIDSELFKPDQSIERKPHLLSMVNDWINRDVFCGYSLWKQVSEGLPVRVRGNTPGLSTGTNSVEEVLFELNNASIYLNTSIVSPIPTALLEAASVGCAIVSTATCAIPEIFEHEKNAFLSNDPAELREYCQMLLSDGDLCKKMGDAARQVIVTRFSMDRFVKQWNEVIAKAITLK